MRLSESIGFIYDLSTPLCHELRMNCKLKKNKRRYTRLVRLFAPRSDWPWLLCIWHVNQYRTFASTSRSLLPDSTGVCGDLWIPSTLSLKYKWTFKM